MSDTIVAGDNTISYSGVIQDETIQTTGSYEITAYGAQGGAGGSGGSGGYGAEVGGLFHLTQGEVLAVFVGSEGSVGTPGYGDSKYTGRFGTGGSGGGASFVVLNSESFAPFVIAGGGGGGAGGNSERGFGGYATARGHYNMGFSGDYRGGQGGGGVGYYDGGGLDGGVGGYGSGGTGGYGGGGQGGFGGGGGLTGGGGGGGYSGGDGGDGEKMEQRHGYFFYVASATAGQGGDSFDAGHHAILLSGENAGDGLVTIDQVNCFLEGTLLATPRGERRIENLQPGDRVLTASGEIVPVRWVGHRRFRLSVRPDVAPIRFRAAALAPNVPHRDLLVSPEHAMGLDGKLVPARLLVNGRTIIRDTSLEQFTYFHIELPRHDLLLAEGAEAESWLDTGNRGAFANAPGTVDLHANFAPNLASEAWLTQSCAPLVEGGEALAVIRTRLVGRAFAQGYKPGGVTTLSLEREGRHTVVLSAGSTGLLRLASIAARAEGDMRRLGAVVAEITLDGIVLPLEDRRLALGFHPIETEGDRVWRWTDGQALVDLGSSHAARHMTVTVAAVPAGQVWASAA
jgi:collagen type I/II/III/V/XI/XXIV/XXVII alpha